MGNNKHKNEGRATYLQHIFLAYKNNKPNETGKKNYNPDNKEQKK